MMKPLHKAVTHCGWANARWIEFIAAMNGADQYTSRESATSCWVSRRGFSGSPVKHRIVTSGGR